MKIFKIVIGTIIFASVFYAYMNCMNKMYEITSVFNLCSGLILIIDGILGLCHKKMPKIIYQIMIPATVIVLIMMTISVTLFGEVEFSFSGGMLFLHAINPITFILIYILGNRKNNIQTRKELLIRLFISPVGFIAYMFFDYIYMLIEDAFIHNSLRDDLGFGLYLLIGIGCYVIAIGVSYGMFKLKDFADARIERAEDNEYGELD